MLELKLLLLVMVANGVPVLACWLLQDRLARQIDNGLILADGQPLLGRSKTWRGLLITVLITPGVALLLGLGASTGLIIASMAMLGDLTSSFIKRRLGIRSSGIAPGLDQIPESLLPLWAVKPVLGLDWQQIMLIVAGFLLLGYVMSFVLYKLHVRRYPY